MAKKKEEANEDGFDDLEGLNSGEIESVYPKLEKSKKESKSDDLGVVDDSSEEEEEEEEFVEPIQDDTPTYKYLDLEITEKEGNNNYEIYIEGQSHGFLNVFVKLLLDLEGVDIAAYKKNNLQSPMIFLKLNDGYKIKEILREGINNLRDEVIDVQKIFKKLM